MKSCWTLGLLLLLGACNRPHIEPLEPVVRTVRVEVPVVQKCDARSKIGPRMEHPDTDTALQKAANLFERVKLLMAGREERKSREEVLERAVDACAS